MKTLPLLVAVAATLASLTGCASDPSTYVDRDKERAELYRAHAGAPVDGFLGRINSWTSLDEHSLVVWTGANKGYLLEVMGPCQELPWAHEITLSNGQFSRVTRFDKVMVRGRGVDTMPCPIREIRPIDSKAVREAQKQAKAAKEAG